MNSQIEIPNDIEVFCAEVVQILALKGCTKFEFNFTCRVPNSSTEYKVFSNRQYSAEERQYVDSYRIVAETSVKKQVGKNG